MRGSSSKSWLILVLFLVIGAVIGGALGEYLLSWPIFADVAPYMAKQYVLLNMPPLTIDLYIAKIVVGLVLQPTLMSILGILLGIFIYSRM